jgi:hypothetical protein
MFFGTSAAPTRPRAVAKGQPGDLTLLAAPPNQVLEELDAQQVTTTVVAGQLVFER